MCHALLLIGTSEPVKHVDASREVNEDLAQLGQTGHVFKEEFVAVSTGGGSPCTVAILSSAAAWRYNKRSMTAGGMERWRRMSWSAPRGAVSKALRSSKEKT